MAQANAGETRPTLARRLASMAYESLLAGALLLALFVFPHVLIGAFGDRSAPPPLLWAHVFLVLLAYFVWFWTHGGQTPAMKTWRLRVVARDGQALPPPRALLRYVAAWPSLAFAGIGVLWALVDRERLFLHDRLAGTRLVIEPAPTRSTADGARE